MDSRASEPDLDACLDRIEDALDGEDIAAARKALRKAERAFPGNLDLLEWEAAILVAEDRLAEALDRLDRVLDRDPTRVFARRERAGVLIDLGRFSEAAEILRGLIGEVSRELEADDDRSEEEEEEEEEQEDEAGLYYDLGLCLDRLGRSGDADREFRAAERRAPETFPRPPRLEAEEFDAIVTEALDAIPPRFRPYLDQVAIVVEDYPSTPLDDPFLLGLYDGVPRTERSFEGADPLERIFVYKRNHELQFPTREELRDEVQKTVVHEIAHHFGLLEHEMGDYA